MWEKAGFFSRVAAHLIDWVAISLVFFVFQRLTFLRIRLPVEFDPADLLASAAAGLFLSIFFLVIFFAYFTYFHGALGQTPGKMILGIKVVPQEGSYLSYTDAFVRTLAYQASWSSLGLGFLWAAFQREGQTWHDRIAGTRVVKVRREEKFAPRPEPEQQPAPAEEKAADVPSPPEGGAERP